MLRYLLLMTMVLSAGAAMAIEKPSYDVVWESEAFEIRRYAPAILAQTAVQGSFKQVGNDAFRKLGGYIFGQNVTEEKIAMTAPVTQSAGKDGTAMRFFLPASYTMDTAPVPSDDRVKLVLVRGGIYAVHRYSGRSSVKNFNDAAKTLFDALRREGITAVGVPIKATYNGPFTPFFLRRNEAMVRIDG